MSVIQGNAIESGLAAYEIPNSLKFNSADSAYLSWTPASAGSLTTWTYSVWVKRTAIGAGQRLFFAWQGTSGTIQTHVMFQSNDTILFEVYNDPTDYKLITTQVFRDPSSWYHIVAVYDSTNATSGDRMRLYVNGSRITAFGTAAYPSQNYQGLVNSTNVHNIGRRGDTGVEYFNGYMTEINHVDGQALDPTSFGEYNSETGVWQPKAYTGSYGTNGFYLPMTQDQIVEGFNTVLYRSGLGKNRVTGVGFKPSMVWVKNRDVIQEPSITDAVRGVNSQLRPAYTSAESTYTDCLTSFDADGFTLGTDATNNSYNYYSGNAVAWCWDAGNSTVTNNDGTITGAQVRASQTYGFSVVTWASQSSGSATIGHGLGTAPSLIIQKNRSSGSTDWWVYHSSLGATKYTKLNTTDAQGTASSIWNDTAPTTTVFSNGSAFTPSANYVAYCFAETGYSKFGSYTGNGSSTGPTVTLGWRPAFVLIKKTSDVDDWAIFDTTRQTTNAITKVLNINSASEATGTSPYITVSDTGFQITATSNMVNTNGGTYIYAAFKDQREAAFWRDFSGNGNHWQPNNLDFNDSVVDVPTNYGTDTGVGAEVRGNYATWNPLDKDDGISSVTEGNLKVVTNGSNGSIKSTIAFPSGKWYWEVTSDSISGSGTQAIGIMPQSQPPTNNMSDSGKLGYAIDASFSDRKFENGTATSYGSYTQANGAVYMLAFDQDAGKLWYGVNGTWLASGDPAAGTNPSSSSISTSTAYCAAVSDNTVSGTFTANFGQLPFAYTAPSGFKALCTQNLPEPTVVDGGDYFNVKLWDGTGATQTITTGLANDLVWTKDRGAAYDHTLFDVIRTPGYFLRSNATSAEEYRSDSLTAFTSTGFSVGADSVRQNINKSGNAYVSWAWKAGGTGVSNTAGTINSTVSANPTAGFSIITYTGNGTSGATIGHGLSSAPAFFVVKGRSFASNWLAQHVSVGNGSALTLNSTAAASASSTYWNNTSPSSTVITLGNGSETNPSGSTMVCYAFAPVEGYSAFGSYTGNGSSDGPFVYTGFRVRWLLLKETTPNNRNWMIFDAVRSPYNQVGLHIMPNSSDAEGTGSGIYNQLDFLSNGVKFRAGTNSEPTNESGATYIYAAFAENPFKFSLAR